MNAFELFAQWFIMAWLALFATAVVTFAIGMRIVAWWLEARREPFSKQDRR